MLKRLRRLIPKLSEPSTWRGFVLIGTAVGANWSPESQVAIVNTGLLLTGLLGAFVADDKDKG